MRENLNGRKSIASVSMLFPDITNNLKPAWVMVDSQEPSRYFYHSDHLGSSSFITDASGTAIQHLQYLPFGENFVDQQTGQNTPYKFSGKEKDDETGYSYFGARYYDSELSVWLSVDPLANAYPSMSPFLYCEGRPVVMQDKNGEWPEPIHTAMIKAAAYKLSTDHHIMLSSKQIKWMIKGSIEADKLANQSTDKSYIHYMRDPSVTNERAIADANQWVNDNINKYASGNEDKDAYMALGMAMHTMMDATSPTHATQNEDGTYSPVKNDLPGLDSKTGKDIISRGMDAIIVDCIKLYGHLEGEGEDAAARQMDKSVNNIIEVIAKGFNKKCENKSRPDIAIRLSQVRINASKIK